MKNSVKSIIKDSNVSHSQFEDVMAMLIGTFIISFALTLMSSSNTLSGGTMGLALLVHYITNIKVGILFFLFNIPFYYLAFKRLGTAMVIKTFMAIALLSAMIELHPLFINLDNIDSLYGTILANVLIGIGLLILFRHRSSLGGFNLLALFIQEHYKIPAGRVQMAMDVSVLIASFAFVDWKLLIFSNIGAIILNMILTTNHRTDRYIGH